MASCSGQVPETSWVHNGQQVNKTWSLVWRCHGLPQDVRCKWCNKSRWPSALQHPCTFLPPVPCSHACTLPRSLLQNSSALRMDHLPIPKLPSSHGIPCVKSSRFGVVGNRHLQVRLNLLGFSLSWSWHIQKNNTPSPDDARVWLPLNIFPHLALVVLHAFLFQSYAQ